MPNYPAQINFPEVNEAAKKLKGALNDAKIFSERARFDSWANLFAEATDLLSHSMPVIPYHPDLLPPHCQKLSSRQLMASACKAWVFGGMGSWNDLCFEDTSLQKDYNSVTVGLYQAVMGAIGAATNSTAGSVLK